MENRIESLINAVEGGEYAFGKRYLRQSQIDENYNEYDAYCFAGVACEEYYKLHPETSFWEASGFGYDYYRFGLKDVVPCASRPPKTVCEFFGIPLQVMWDVMEHNDRDSSDWDDVLSEFKTKMGI